jgi:hypothetical protein
VHVSPVYDGDDIQAPSRDLQVLLVLTIYFSLFG